MNPELEKLLRTRATALVFVPAAAEFQRFAVAGAFEELAKRVTLHYAIPAGTLETMRAAAPDRLGASNVSEVPMSFDRSALDQPPVDDGPLVRPTHDGGQPLPAIVGLLNRLNPLLCLVLTSTPDVFCHHVAWACEIEMIGCVILQSGWGDVTGKTIHRPPTPVLTCWGQESARHVKAVQRLDHIVVQPLGPPHYDVLTSTDPEDVRRLRAELGVGSSERLLLFAGSITAIDEIKILRRLERAIAEGRLNSLRVVYQPHPRTAGEREEEFVQHEWKHVVLHTASSGHHADQDRPTRAIGSLVPLLSSVDAVIGPPSTLLIESLMLEKPSAVMVGREYRDQPDTTAEMRRWAELKSSKALVWSAKKKHLLDACDTLLQAEVGSREGERRARLAESIATRAPGTYAKRLATFCNETLTSRLESLRFKRAGSKRTTISHTYGAHEIAAAYCHVSPDNVVPGYWMHGWIPEYHNVDPAVVALHKRDPQRSSDFAAQIRHEKEGLPQFVSRKDQADYLIAQGYERVAAIGLPIAYVPEQRIRRVPGSLLVLPPHGHKSHGPGDPVAERYAGVIADLKPRFEQIVVGLTEDDFIKQEWVTSFRRHGIEVVMTAQQSDRGTIARLATILSAFEYVTTNGFGSQIAYAAYCGAKVSVYGPYANFSRDRMALVDIIRTFPDLLDQALYLCSEDALLKHYPFLFVNPDEAQVLQEWGAREVGEPCRASPEELARLFGWAPGGVPAVSTAVHTTLPRARHRNSYFPVKK